MDESALLLPLPGDTPPRPSALVRCRLRAQSLLASRQKHYLVLALVGLDVCAILAEILVSLVTCDTGSRGDPWVDTLLEITKSVGFVISCLFVVELVATVWAFGCVFFCNWFHCFDAFVILVSFVVDVLAHGIVEEIASLVVVLRLWRMVKIVEEMSVGASEQMEELEAQVEKLEAEKADLEKERDFLQQRLQAAGI